MTWIVVLVTLLVITVVLALLSRDIIALVNFILLTAIGGCIMMVWIDMNYGMRASDIPQALAWGSVLAFCLIIVRQLQARSSDSL